MSCGINKAEFLEDEAPRLENYLKKGYHGKMNYMENHFIKIGSYRVSSEVKRDFIVDELLSKRNSTAGYL